MTCPATGPNTRRTLSKFARTPSGDDARLSSLVQNSHSAAGTASGAMGFLQMGLGALLSQFGAWLGGHFATPVPLNIAIVVLSIACASTMAFLIPRRDVIVSEELIEQAEEEESGLL